MLAANRKEGVLTVSRNKDRKMIYFTPDGIRLAALGRRKLHTLGEILLRTQRITREQLDGILEKQRQTGQKLGEVVTKLGVLTQKEIDKALREQVEEEIHDLFLWEDATFEFKEGGPFPTSNDNPLAEVTLEADLTSLMLEAARRADELDLIRDVIPDDKVIPVREVEDPPLTNPNLDADSVRQIYPLLDGLMTAGEIVSASLHPRFNVLRTLYVLASEGAIRIVTQDGEITTRRKRTPDEEVPAAPSRIGGQPTLLLASDLPQFRQKLAASLRSSRYDVVEQAVTKDLIAAAGRHRIDAAILDLSLITSDALRLCAPLRKVIRGPIIVLSANTSKDAVVTAIKAGARDFVVKPFNHELLLERLSQLLVR
jgi:CheY-like chemotaxis protein